jgi:hypothetical protein
VIGLMACLPSFDELRMALGAGFGWKRYGSGCCWMIWPFVVFRI